MNIAAVILLTTFEPLKTQKITIVPDLPKCVYVRVNHSTAGTRCLCNVRLTDVRHDVGQMSCILVENENRVDVII